MLRVGAEAGVFFYERQKCLHILQQLALLSYKLGCLVLQQNTLCLVSTGVLHTACNIFVDDTLDVHERLTAATSHRRGMRKQID